MPWMMALVDSITSLIIDILILELMGLCALDFGICSGSLGQAQKFKDPRPKAQGRFL